MQRRTVDSDPMSDTPAPDAVQTYDQAEQALLQGLRETGITIMRIITTLPRHLTFMAARWPRYVPLSKRVT